jgi:hypothetical protein
LGDTRLEIFCVLGGDLDKLLLAFGSIRIHAGSLLSASFRDKRGRFEPGPWGIWGSQSSLSNGASGRISFFKLLALSLRHETACQTDLAQLQKKGIGSDGRGYNRHACRRILERIYVSVEGRGA